MTYVTLLPHSNTNPSNMYVVIDAATWQDSLNRGAAVNPIASYQTFRDAEEVKDRLNREAGRQEKLQALADAMKNLEWKLNAGVLDVLDELELLDGHVSWQPARLRS